MRTTIRQIAEQSSLSIQTVSQILNGNSSAFRPDTQERVFRAARELGYRPNASARAMQSGRFGAVSLLLSTHNERSLLPSGLLDGLLDGTAANNLSLHIARLPDETLVNPEALPKVLRELSVDGLLIKYDSAAPSEMIALIEQSKFPALWLNSRETYDCIYTDDLGAGRTATEYLLSLGHRRIAYVDWLHAGHYSRDDRLAGYREAMETAGLEPYELWPQANWKIEPSFDQSDQAVQQTVQRPFIQTNADQIRTTFDWLIAPDRPTALVTYHGGMALAIYHAALLLNLRIPQDLSLITFSDQTLNPIGVDIAAMLLPQRLLGIRAIEMLLEKQRAPALHLPSCTLALELAAGATTAPPPDE